VKDAMQPTSPALVAGDTLDRSESPAVAGQPRSTPAAASPAGATLALDGHSLTFERIVDVAHGRLVAEVADDAAVRDRVDASRRVVLDGVAAGRVMYGVTTGFGGMADLRIPQAEAAALQRNLLHHLHVGIGDALPARVVRGAMLLRVNSHLRGASGIGWPLIDRLLLLLRCHATPVVRRLGSIGASGDLIPLAAIAGAAIGAPGYEIEMQGRVMRAREALWKLGVTPLELEPKAGLAMINGTAVSAAWAIDLVDRARSLLRATLGFHALCLQALGASAEGLSAFVHEHKPHAGQRAVAASLRRALDGSRMTTVRDERGDRPGLVQDRYSVRCIPQFLGPVLDTLASVSGELEVEANSTTDNPLIDARTGEVHNGGNFLAQYVATGLDRVRAQLALTAKHTDVQIAMLMSPSMSDGLPPSLVGNSERARNMGLKGLQIAGNSLMPLVAYFSTPLADRFPTHAEQFNQNINSQSFGAAHLADLQLGLMEQHLACGLLAAVQAVDLRAELHETPARDLLSPGTIAVYRKLRAAVGRADDGRPIAGHDEEQVLEHWVQAVAREIAEGGSFVASSPRLS
jgi:phenylalanine ammonia-lyase